MAPRPRFGSLTAQVLENPEQAKCPASSNASQAFLLALLLSFLFNFAPPGRESEPFGRDFSEMGLNRRHGSMFVDRSRTSRPGFFGSRLCIFNTFPSINKTGFSTFYNPTHSIPCQLNPQCVTQDQTLKSTREKPKALNRLFNPQPLRPRNMAQLQLLVQEAPGLGV